MASNEYNVPVPHDRIAIVCLYCNKPQEIGAKAMSVTCRFCNKPLRLQDVRVELLEVELFGSACFVYRRRMEPERSLLTLGLYVAFFPQLVAGPIVRFHEIRDQLVERTETTSTFVAGIYRFSHGLG